MKEIGLNSLIKVVNKSKYVAELIVDAYSINDIETVEKLLVRFSMYQEIIDANKDKIFSNMEWEQI